jgi:hypothetical protein
VSRKLPNVGSLERLAEEADRPFRRIEVRGHDLEQGGLAGAVRAEENPPLTGTDLPADVLDESGPVLHDGDMVDAHDWLGVHQDPASYNLREPPTRRIEGSP